MVLCPFLPAGVQIFFYNRVLLLLLQEVFAVFCAADGACLGEHLMSTSIFLLS